VLSQEDRLRPEDRLRQQPAGDSTEESQSRRRRRNPSNGCFAESSLASTRSTEARDRRDASHARSPPISGQEPSPRKDPRQKGEHMPRRCWPKGKRHFIKLPSSDKESEGSGSRQDRNHGGAGCPPNLKPDPCLYKGVWTLRLGRSDLSSSSSRPNSSRSVVTTVKIIRNKAVSRGVTSGVEGPEPR
jgi:hypothetical protein